MSSTLDDLVKSSLKTNVFTRMGRGGGGCINEGEGYTTDNGNVFVKRNSRKEARVMFDGEFEGLKAIKATNTVRVPTPIHMMDNPNVGAVLVMEYIEMSPLRKYAAQLGEQIARLHLFNQNLLDKAKQLESSVHTNDQLLALVSHFGFHCTTCCGIIPQDNSWCDDWVTFYTKQKLEQQIDRLRNEYGDRELLELWAQLVHRIPSFFSDCHIQPALLHGDLWGGNVAETPDGPVIFDCATFYGHSEFELGIATMFGGFSSAFFQSYHSLIPKTPGFETRLQLYQLFHYLNHWNHFGTGYRSSSLSIMRKLVAKR